MAQPPQVFFPSPKKLVGAGFFVLFFLGWTIFSFAIFFIQPDQRPIAWPGYVMVNGVPSAMFLLSIRYLLGALAKTTVDDDAIRIQGPLGTQNVRWADVTGHDITGTRDQGMTLYTRDGRQIGIPFTSYEGSELRERMDAELAKLPPPTIEGRVFPMAGRWPISLLLGGMVLFMHVAFSTLPSRRPSDQNAIFMLYVLDLFFVPFIAYVLTDRIVLENGTLKKRSCFGTKSVPLTEVRKAILSIVSNKNGRSELLTLEGPSTLRIGAQRKGYAMLRDAVLAEIPSAVIEDKRLR